MTAPLQPEDVLGFWFEEAGPKRWFSVDPAFDAKVRRRFGLACHALRDAGDVGEHPWLVDAQSALALVLLCDQFPRNIWRGSNAAFDLDPLARQASHAMLGAGFDLVLPERERGFVYMPLMHSEDIEDQALCVALCEDRLGETADISRHARLHRDVIVRFGRFPHRNAALGRRSTQDEAAYLDNGGYAPGAKRPAK